MDNVRMNLGSMTMILIHEEDLLFLKAAQQEILKQLKELQRERKENIPLKNITAKEFMDAVRIRRTKFDQLVRTSKIRIIKKCRKIYVPVTEIDRYFTDKGIP